MKIRLLQITMVLLAMMLPHTGQGAQLSVKARLDSAQMLDMWECVATAWSCAHP